MYSEQYAREFGRVIPDLYRRMDDILGRTLEQADRRKLDVIVLLGSWFQILSHQCPFEYLVCGAGPHDPERDATP